MSHALQSKPRRVRRLFFVGDADLPECPPTNAADTKNDEPTPSHPNLRALWQVADDSGRMFYAATQPSEFGGFPAGTFAGLYALKHAAIGSATQGMHEAIRHAPSLDHCFPGDVGVLRVAAGSRSSVMLLTTGILIALSRNPDVHGTVVQLPESAIDPSSGEPARILDVAAGATHFVCCDDHGRVYTWGWGNEFGQLGDGSIWPRNEALIDVHEPKQLKQFGVHDAARDEVSASEKRYSVLAQTPNPSICAVACGKHHTLLLTAQYNGVYTFGRNHRGQLGRQGLLVAANPNADLAACPSPRIVQSAFGAKIVQVAAAADSHHSLLLLASGKVLGFGENTTGAIGTGALADASCPTPAAFVGDLVSTSSSTAAPASTESAGAASRQKCAASQKSVAPYGTPQSYLHPRRVRRVDESLQPGQPAAQQMSTSATHTVLVAGDKAFSAGLRPIRGPPSSTIHVDSLGALGRPVRSRADGLAFGAVSQRTMLPTNRAGTQAVTTSVAGAGFTALVDESGGTLSIHGTITKGGQVCVGSGLRPSRHVGADESDRDDRAAVQLGLGPTGRIVGAFPSFTGLLLLVESDN